MYRIPTSTSNGNKYSLTQYNLVDGKAKKPAQYRKEILSEIKKYVKDNEDIEEIILAGDFNQDIRSNEVQQFFIELGIQDVHSKDNNLRVNELDNTHIHRSQPIDLIAVSPGILEFIERCALLNHNEIIPSDHRVYLVDFNAEEYFQNEISE